MAKLHIMMDGTEGGIVTTHPVDASEAARKLGRYVDHYRDVLQVANKHLGLP